MTVSLDLTDRTALVTGSTGGIGLAIATGLARAGARVAVNGRGEERVRSGDGSCPSRATQPSSPRPR